jgi:hypothetical protein
LDPALDDALLMDPLSFLSFSSSSSIPLLIFCN